MPRLRKLNDVRYDVVGSNVLGTRNKGADKLYQFYKEQ